MARNIKFKKDEASLLKLLQEIYNDIGNHFDRLIVDIEDRQRRHKDKLTIEDGTIEIHEDTSLSKSNVDVYKQIDNVIGKKIELAKLHKNILETSNKQGKNEGKTITADGDDFQKIRDLLKTHKSQVKQKKD